MDIEELKQSGTIIFEVIAGSQAYGTNTPQSDIDIRGIFITPINKRLSLFNHIDEVNNSTQDIKYYELQKFMILASGCNPNIIELLWTPLNCIKICTDTMNLIIQNRNLFISKRAFHTFSGYAYAQIKKARGQNKMVYNPQPKEPPKREDFCWFISSHLTAMEGPPARPIPLQSVPFIRLEDYHVAAMEHMENTYRLYYYGSKAKGVFRGDDTLVCESIPVEDEREKFQGLLIYNKVAYDAALKDWHRYWDWKNNRNDARWIDQENGDKDYDQKNMMHCMRLLLSGENILKYGKPIVRFEGKELQYLRDIRSGQYKYEEIIAEVEKKMIELKDINEKSNIPHHPDTNKIDDLFMKLLNL